MKLILSHGYPYPTPENPTAEGVDQLVKPAPRALILYEVRHFEQKYTTTVEFKTADASQDLEYLCGKWPKAANSDGYSVPCPGYTDSAEGYCATKDKWTGEYGLLRMELLDWLIQETAP